MEKERKRDEVDSNGGERRGYDGLKMFGWMSVGSSMRAFGFYLWYICDEKA